LDVVTENLSVALGSSLAETLSALSACHKTRQYDSLMMSDDDEVVVK
jgi:hypothetical protein